MNKAKLNTIPVWTNSLDPDELDLDFIREEYGEDCANNPEWLAQYAYDCNSDYMHDLVDEFKCMEGRHIVAIIKGQKWDGNYLSVLPVNGGMRGILTLGGGNYDSEFFLDRWNFKALFHHHDGCHSILFREVKPEWADDVREIMYRIQITKKQNVLKQKINRYTKTLRPYFCNVWGIK